MGATAGTALRATVAWYDTSFAMAVGTGRWYLGGVFMLAFVITQTFFMQLGISLGRLVDKKWGARFEKAFPWICLSIGLFYIVLFAVKLVPVAE